MAHSVNVSRRVSLRLGAQRRSVYQSFIHIDSMDPCNMVAPGACHNHRELPS